MQRTQISLTADERRVLDEVSAQTGRSVSGLIREAIDRVYGVGRSNEADLTAIAQSAGSWQHRDEDTEAWVDRLRSGRRRTSPRQSVTSPHDC